MNQTTTGSSTTPRPSRRKTSRFSDGHTPTAFVVAPPPTELRNDELMSAVSAAERPSVRRQPTMTMVTRSAAAAAAATVAAASTAVAGAASTATVKRSLASALEVASTAVVMEEQAPTTTQAEQAPTSTAPVRTEDVLVLGKRKSASTKTHTPEATKKAKVGVVATTDEALRVTASPAQTSTLSAAESAPALGDLDHDTLVGRVLEQRRRIRDLELANRRHEEHACVLYAKLLVTQHEREQLEERTQTRPAMLVSSVDATLAEPARHTSERADAEPFGIISPPISRRAIGIRATPVPVPSLVAPSRAVDDVLALANDPHHVDWLSDVAVSPVDEIVDGHHAIAQFLEMSPTTSDMTNATIDWSPLI